MTKKYACPSCDTLNYADTPVCVVCGHEMSESFRSTKTRIYKSTKEDTKGPETIGKSGTDAVKSGKTRPLVEFEKKPPVYIPSPTYTPSDTLPFLLKILCLFCFPIGFIIAWLNDGEKRISALSFSVGGIILYLIGSIILSL